MEKSKKTPRRSPSLPVRAQKKPPVARSLALVEQDITTAQQFARVMSAVLGDMVRGAMTPQVGNAVANVGGKLLRVVELQLKYGREKPLPLLGG